MLQHDINYTSKSCRQCGLTYLDMLASPTAECRGYRTEGLGDAFYSLTAESVFISEPPKSSATWLHVPVVDAEENPDTKTDTRSQAAKAAEALHRWVKMGRLQPYIVVEVWKLERNGVVVGPGGVSKAFLDSLREPRRFDTPGRKWLVPDRPTGEKAYAAGQMLAALATGVPVPRFGVNAVTAYVHPRSLNGRVNVAALGVDDPNGDDVS